MSFTRSQLHERISDLSGMLRAAQENKRLTAEKRVEQERLSDLARQADDKADAQLADVIADLRDANRQYALAVEEIIEPAPAEQTAPDMIVVNDTAAALFGQHFNDADTLADRLMANGEAKVNEALNRAQEGF